VGHRGSIRQLKFSVKVVCHNAAIFYCGKLVADDYAFQLNTALPEYLQEVTGVKLRSMPSPHLNKPIRELCGRALNSEQPELEMILEELRAALHEYAEELSKLAAAKLVRSESKGAGSVANRRFRPLSAQRSRGMGDRRAIPGPPGSATLILLYQSAC